MTPNIMPTGFDPNCAVCMYWVDRLTPDQLADVQEVMHGEAGTHTVLYRDGDVSVIGNDFPAPAQQEGLVPLERTSTQLAPIDWTLEDIDPSDPEDERTHEDREADRGTVRGALMEQEIAERETADGEDKDPA